MHEGRGSVARHFDELKRTEEALLRVASRVDARPTQEPESVTGRVTDEIRRPDLATGGSLSDWRGREFAGTAAPARTGDPQIHNLVL